MWICRFADMLFYSVCFERCRFVGALLPFLLAAAVFASDLVELEPGARLSWNTPEGLARLPLEMVSEGVLVLSDEAGPGGETVSAYVFRGDPVAAKTRKVRLHTPWIRVEPGRRYGAALRLRIDGVLAPAYGVEREGIEGENAGLPKQPTHASDSFWLTERTDNGWELHRTVFTVAGNQAERFRFVFDASTDPYHGFAVADAEVRCAAAGEPFTEIGGGIDLGPDFSRVGDTISTPSFDWARKLEGGPVRALVICHRHFSREVAELRQRMDIDCDTILTEVPSDSPEELWSLPYVQGYRDPGVLAAAALEKVRGDHDVIVVALNGVRWEWLPAELRDAILARVGAGAGLLLTGGSNRWPEEFSLSDRAWPRDVDWMVGSHPETIRDSNGRKMDSRAAIRPHGKGRILGLPLPGSFTAVVTSGAHTAADYEHAMQWGIRCLLAAADRAPTPWVDIGVTVEEGAATVEGELSRPADITVHIVDARNRAMAEPIHRASRPGFRCALPPLPAGEYWCRVWADSDGRRISYASVPFSIKVVAGIRSITATDELRHVGQPAHFLVAVDPGARGSLVSRIYDVDERLLATRQHTGTPSEIALTIPPTYSIVHHLEIDLVSGGRVVDRKRHTFGVQQTIDPADFTMGFWGSRGGAFWPDRHRQRLLYEYGIDVGMFAIRPDGHVKIMDYARHMPRVVRKAESEPPWPYDPVFRDKTALAMTEGLQTTREWSPVLMTLGDEPSYRHQDRTPPALARFQSCMKDQFGSLADLNVAWGSSFTDWHEVERVPLMEALRRFNGNLASAFASWSYNRRVTGDFYTFQRELAQALLPGVRCGPEGIWGNPEYYAIDYPRLLREHGFVGTYFRKDTMGVVRSLGNDNLVAGPWYGGYEGQFVHQNFLRNVPWTALLEGMNYAAWFAGRPHPTRGSWPMPLTCPDWSLNTHVAPAFEEIRKIKSGLAKLLLTSDREHDGIALVYPTIDSRKAFTKWAILLEAHGFQVDYLTEADIESGRLMNDGWRMLVLSEVTCVSDAFRDAVSVFVHGGGTLVIDRFGGLYDENGTPREEGAFDALCGVTERMWPKEIPGRERPREWEGWVLAMQGNPIADVSGFPCRLTDRPVMIGQNVGRGRTLYMNLSLGDANRLLPEGFHVVGEVCKWADLHAPVPVMTGRDETVGLMVVRYARDPLNLVAIHRQLYPFAHVKGRPDLTEWDVDVRLDSVQHVYDAYEGRYVGYTNRYAGVLSVGHPVLLTQLPFRVMRVELRPLEPAIAAGSPLIIDVVLAGANGRSLEAYDGVLHARLIRPDGTGTRLQWRNVPFTSGHARIEWPTALNAPPGQWRVTVRDVATGVSGEVGIAVRETRKRHEP